VEHLPVARVPNLSRALEHLRREGFWTLGADPEAGDDLFDAPARVFEGDLAVVLGAEGRGLRPGVERLLDHRVRIPMAGRLASLNVATAAAVVLFEVLRRRRGAARREGPVPKG
jgi:23S rRNA (guanosine2251-2'-O)-methyltransferase